MSDVCIIINAILLYIGVVTYCCDDNYDNYDDEELII